MRQGKDFRDGFSTPAAMILIFSLCISIMSLSMFVLAKQKKIKTYQDIYSSKKNIQKILSNIVEDFQSIAEETIDNYQNEKINNFISKYNTYEIQLEDVSSKINEVFLSKKILNSKEIQSLLLKYGENIVTEYGWINSRIIDSTTIEEIKKDFDTENIFPIGNNLPLYNIYFMNEDFIKAICSITNVVNYEKNITSLIWILNNSNNQITEKEIGDILKISKGHLFFSFVGTKTTFWKITFADKKCKVSVILAGYPNAENKISEYKIIEKNIEYLGGIK